MHRLRAEIVAHRGASAYAPENTIAAFDLALTQGADVLELDVRPAADGHLILVHDPTLERIAGDPRAVAALTRTAIASLDALTRPAGFEEFLERYARVARLLIDLKDTTPEAEEQVIEAIERHRLRGRVVVQSFDHEALRRVREAAPWVPVAPLVHGDDDPLPVLDLAAELAGGIGIRHDAIDAELVHAVRGAGLALRAWTVDDALELERLLHLGVDAVITNAPDVAFAAMRPAAAA